MTYEVRDGVAHVRFTRPEGANAVNPTFAAGVVTEFVTITYAGEAKLYVPVSALHMLSLYLRRLRY